MQSEHEAAWTAATTDNEANQKAWTQAHNMICVADSTTYENCEVPACPEVTKPHIDPEVAAADCSTEEEGYGSNAETCTVPICPDPKCWRSTPCRYEDKCFHSSTGVEYSCSCSDKDAEGKQRYEMPVCA